MASLRTVSSLSRVRRRPTGVTSRRTLSLFGLCASLVLGACGEDPSDPNEQGNGTGATSTVGGSGGTGSDSGGNASSGGAGDGGTNPGAGGAGDGGTANIGGNGLGGEPYSGGSGGGEPGSGGVGDGGSSPGDGGTSSAGGTGSGGGTGGATPTELTISIWHDERVEVGGPRAAGLPQDVVNVLGRIWFTGPSLVRASYRVNGGPATPLPVGPTNSRLALRGDFNIEIPLAALRSYPEENRVLITAEDGTGTVEQEVPVVVRPTAPTTPSLLLDWSKLTSPAQIDDVAALVDGHWDLRDDGVHTVHMAYDRLLAVGDRNWSPAYEVVAEVTLHAFRLWGGLGVAIGWQGHAGTATPRKDWPLEALGWVRFRGEGHELQIMTFTRFEVARKPVHMTTGTYVYRVRSEPLGGGLARFSVKYWPSAESEPAGWMLQYDVPERRGSVLLVAHHADVTWKTLRVTPL